MANHYDAIIIGAGMSGLAAGIRLAMFDKKVAILEQHSISGGLNSYYSRRIKETKEIVRFDVGLHALTNFASKGERRKPFTKLLKQLRIPYDDFSLREQSYSLIKFKSEELKFTNDFELFKTEILEKFPTQIDSFIKFVNHVSDYNEVNLDAKYLSARKVLKEYFTDELLMEMLIAPLLIYGSAWENDMDFSQFVIMFKSLYFEGFSRPEGGVRTILDLLIEKYKSLGGELLFKKSVDYILDHKSFKEISVNNREVYNAKIVFSSAGIVETKKLLKEEIHIHPKVGKLSFLETIYLTRQKNVINNHGATIVFYNDSDHYFYERPHDSWDKRSAVICFPDNYEKENIEGYGTIRVTSMANYKLWKEFSESEYLAKKEDVFLHAKDLGKKILNSELDIVYKDVFSPTTIERYTRHVGGTVYGSPDKVRNGHLGIEGVYIIGTDQGFLGIVGSMLSGVSMANLYGLMENV